jgi:LysM repeat protein
MTPEEEKLMAESISLHEAARNAGARKMYDDRTGNKVAAANDARIQGLDNALAAPIDAQLKALESAPAPVAAAPVTPSTHVGDVGAVSATPAQKAAMPATAPGVSPAPTPVASAPAAPKPVHISDGWGSSTPTAWGEPVAKPSTPKPVSHPTGGAPVASTPAAPKPVHISDGWGSSTPTAWGEPINKPATPATDKHTPATSGAWGSSTPPSLGGSATAPTPPSPAASPTHEPASSHSPAAPASHSDGGAAVATASYSVVKGDTLSGIAAAHHMSLAEVEALNPQIKNPNLILPGETVHLSANMPTSSSYSGLSSSGGGQPQLVTGATGSGLPTEPNKKGLLGNLLGRFGKGGNTGDGGVAPAADPAQAAVADPTKPKH